VTHALVFETARLVVRRIAPVFGSNTVTGGTGVTTRRTGARATDRAKTRREAAG
jgi:hypothetical protein